MSRWRYVAVGACVASCWIGSGSGSSALAQSESRERDVKVTGPRGRSIERRVEVERGPGYSDRQVQIQRPGGTYSREVRVAGGRPGPPPMYRPGPGYRPGYGFGHRPPVIIERNVFGGAGTFALGMLGGAALTAPLWAPPLVSPPVVVAPGPAVIVQQPAVISAPSVDPLDGVALAAQRLQSHYPGSRREAAQTLGRLGDPRGIPPLVDVLKNDWFKDVRIAAAQALGEIGGPEAEAVLERAVVYEKKQDVRDAAAAALHMARERQVTVHAAAPAPAGTIIESTVEETPRPAMRRPVPPPPAPGVHRPLQWKAKTDAAPPLDEPALEAPADRVPPPPPSPVSSNPGS
ncbi:MAG: HEAT repeat domain-containing protein [Paludisphaera borealis]|uniref:HEAT repeat domain-containing protein n=1 Tax=Paludisphaera borealis TaxID=1387353 RepID=UPI00283E0555|nr:HEAT repeat domain-containing protein [Paludisphaera borealis]MDR3620268.1 HEAT repeat domain-containing protein [Paludisphaera borealis]